jgi:hypothetical protein
MPDPHAQADAKIFRGTLKSAGGLFWPSGPLQIWYNHLLTKFLGFSISSGLRPWPDSFLLSKSGNQRGPDPYKNPGAYGPLEEQAVYCIWMHMLTLVERLWNQRTTIAQRTEGRTEVASSRK